MTTSISGSLGDCKQWKNCEVVVVPQIIHQTLGSGWIFPKQSSLLPIFKHFVNVMKEGAIVSWISSSYDEHKGMPDQVCPDYAGKPIGLEKCFSLLVIMMLGMGLSICFVW